MLRVGRQNPGAADAGSPVCDQHDFDGDEPGQGALYAVPRNDDGVGPDLIPGALDPEQRAQGVPDSGQPESASREKGNGLGGRPERAD